MPENKTAGEVFWENIERYRLANEDSVKEFCQKMETNLAWYNDAKKRKNLPRQTFIQKVAKRYCLQYVDLFEDWDD